MRPSSCVLCKATGDVKAHACTRHLERDRSFSTDGEHGCFRDGVSFYLRGNVTLRYGFFHDDDQAGWMGIPPLFFSFSFLPSYLFVVTGVFFSPGLGARLMGVGWRGEGSVEQRVWPFLFFMESFPVCSKALWQGGV